MATPSPGTPVAEDTVADDAVLPSGDAAGDEDDDFEPPPAGGWRSYEEREAILEKTKKIKPSLERIEGLLHIHQLAELPANRSALWSDSEVRAALLLAAEPPDPDAGQDKYAEGYKEPSPADDVVRVVAFGTMLFLLTSPTSCHLMLHEKALRGRFVLGTLEAELLDSRVRSTLALGCLAVNGACERAGRDLLEWAQQKICKECGGTDCIHLILRPVLPSCDTDICEGLLRGTSSDLPTAVRAGALGALWSVVATRRVNGPALWSLDFVRERLLACAGGGEPLEVRCNAIGTIWALAVDDENKEAIWSDSDARQVLLEAAAPTRLSADGATKPQHVDLRTKALGAVANLAAARCNQEDIWTLEDLGMTALEAAADAGPLRSDAVRALLNLATHEANQAAMVDAGAPGRFLACSEDKALSQRERKNCLLGRERLLEACPPIPRTSSKEEVRALQRANTKQMMRESVSSSPTKSSQR